MTRSRQRKKRINPLDVIMMPIFGCVTAGVGTMLAVAFPVVVLTFIILPIFPSSAHWVESYACDPGGVVEIEEWSEYDHEDQVDESGTEYLCVYEDGSWTESSTEIMVAMILLGILIPGAFAGAIGALLGLLGGLNPNATDKNKKKQPKEAKRAETNDEEVDSTKIETQPPTHDIDSGES